MAEAFGLVELKNKYDHGGDSSLVTHVFDTYIAVKP